MMTTTALTDGQSEFEPALAAIRALEADRLDALVRRWLAGRGLHAARRAGSSYGAVTYLAEPSADPDGSPVLVRLHLRRNALQGHHVDAMVGALCRTRMNSGLLVATGSVARDSVRAAQALRCPRLRLLSGIEWAAELAQAGLLRRGTRRVWGLDLGAASATRTGASSGETEADNAPRW